MGGLIDQTDRHPNPGGQVKDVSLVSKKILHLSTYVKRWVCVICHRNVAGALRQIGGRGRSTTERVKPGTTDEIYVGSGSTTCFR